MGQLLRGRSQSRADYSNAKHGVRYALTVRPLIPGVMGDPDGTDPGSS